MTLKNLRDFIEKLAKLNPEQNPDRFVGLTESKIYTLKGHLKKHRLHKLWLKNPRKHLFLHASTNTYLLSSHLKNVDKYLDCSVYKKEFFFLFLDDYNPISIEEI